MYFFESIIQKMKSLNTHLCVGVDPHQYGLGFFLESQFRENPLSTLEKFCSLLIKASKGRISSLKFQSAFFESFGHEGILILKNSIHAAKQAGLLTILDSKRGDISSTMKAYAETSFEYFDADAMTVTPYMGVDTLEPLVNYLQRGKGVYVVWRTSNPNSGTVQNCKLENGLPFYIHIMDTIYSWTKDHSLSQAMGYVLGATNCSDIDESFRSKVLDMSNGHWLMPGFGSQGAQVTPSLTQLTSKNNHLIPVSRAIYSHDETVDSWKKLDSQFSKNILKYAEQFKFK